MIEGRVRPVGIQDLAQDHGLVTGVFTLGFLHVDLVDDLPAVILRHSNELKRIDAMEHISVVPLVQAPTTPSRVAPRHVDHYDRARRAEF